MDVRQLKALVTVAETGSVTRAAELLHLVQPAVTRQIRALESELGVPLFERTRQGMRVTAAGASLTERARRALTELDRARAELAPPPGGVTGMVSVGRGESTVDLLARPLVSAILHDHPGSNYACSPPTQATCSVARRRRSRPRPALQPDEHPIAQHTILAREKLWVVAPVTDGLHASQPIPLASVAEHPVVMPAPGHALRVLIDGAIAQAKVDLNIAVQTNSMELQKQLVLSGHGWTILPGAGIATDAAPSLFSTAPLAEPEVYRSIAIGTPRVGPITPAAEIVARELARQVRVAARQGRWLSAQVY